MTGVTVRLMDEGWMAKRPTAESEPESSVQSIDRAVRILRAVARHPDGAMLSAISTETNLGKSTVHRLLAALVDAGLAYQDLDTRRYRLSVGLAILGASANRQNFAALLQPHLERLADKIEDTIYGTVREGSAAVCVARQLGAFPIRTLSLDVGHMRPLGVGSGSLAILAFLPDNEIKKCLDQNASWIDRFPPHTIDDIWRRVADTRRRGYSLVEGAVVPGMYAIGVPVLDAKGQAIAALSMAAIAERLRGQRQKDCARDLAKEATALAKKLKHSATE